MKPRLLFAIVVLSALLAIPVNKVITKYRQELKLKDHKIEQIQKENQNLHKQLQTKLSIKARIAQAVTAKAAPEPTPQPVATPVAPPPAPIVVPAPVVTASAAKAFIYAKESGNDPAAVNRYSGACGLGQALPCSKMPCSLSDYACQDNFFTSYMLGRYGSWENAQAFWLSHNWW